LSGTIGCVGIAMIPGLRIGLRCNAGSQGN